MTFTFDLLWSMSARVENALPGLVRVIRPACSRTSSPRAWFVGSFGIATCPPCGISDTDLCLVEYSGNG
ncbi:Uncharacterised protein [Mycobacteroides abscessus subsp. abscessus]|nr:Uncharacterised protein [Mycobacteroides abscessus subsp. abscessus]